MNEIVYEKRIHWIDVAKGLCIILVVLGHSDIETFVDVIISSFHMAAFFMLSGLTFNTKRNFKDFLVRKAKTLLGPYLIFAFILLVYQYIRTLLVSNASFSLSSGLVSIIIPISGRSSTTTYGLWFLPGLFLTEIYVYWIVKLFGRRNWGRAVVLVVLSLIGLGSYQLFNCASIISILPISSLFLGLGYIMKRYIAWIERNKIVIGIISGVLFVVTTWINWLASGYIFDLSSMALGKWPLFLSSGLFGAMCIFLSSMAIPRIKIIENIGENSIYYYGLHYEVLGGIGLIIRRGCLQTFLTITILYFVVEVWKKLCFRGKEQRKSFCK